MWLDRLMKRDVTFPRPVYIGRYRYWNLDAIEKYERAVAAQQPVALCGKPPSAV
jgi:predicted DNA-binding transcriptional regulator AlpA